MAAEFADLAAQSENMAVAGTRVGLGPATTAGEMVLRVDPIRLRAKLVLGTAKTRGAATGPGKGRRDASP
jgi:ribulose 1,5-bisphosphate synthetase/thiazole synthase